MEEGEGDKAAGWFNEFGGGAWANDEAHTGQRSFRIDGVAGATRGWTSDMIPVPEPGKSQFVLKVWAKMEQVTGNNGAFFGFYHTDESGERIGQSGGIFIGGVGQTVTTEPWTQYLTVSALTPEVKGIRINMRLYGSTGTIWWDDVECYVLESPELTAPAALRRGLRVTEPGGTAILACSGGDEQAARIAAALKAKGWDVPVVAPGEVDINRDPRDLILLGNLTTSPAAEHLYLHSYTYEDLYYPGGGGYVLRPLVNPLGNGCNYLVVGASDDAGLVAGVDGLIEQIENAADGLEVELAVKTGQSYQGLSRFPYPLSGPRRELLPAMEYLKEGKLEAAQRYREMMLKHAATPDETLFATDNSLHLYYITQTMSWDLMYACPVFSDDERLTITRYMLKVLRSGEGYGYTGLRGGMFTRENHGTRAAQAFYFGWRHFNKYYHAPLEVELWLWRTKLRDFWAAPFASSRSFEDSLSQHALGGSLVNTLDIGFMEPEWAAEFFASSRARQMGERCIAICNNMGDTVMLGDTNAGDYPASVFSMLAYKLNDGRYWYMLDKRAGKGSSSDEPARGFNVGIEPVVPEDHIGLHVVPADELYFGTALRKTEGVELSEAFDKMTFRGGFDPDDEYLMIDGVAGGSHSYDDANTIGEFSANSRRWLCEIDIFNGPTMAFHNAVTVARDGLGDPEVPQAAQMVRKDSGDGWAYAATRLPNYSGVGWTRHILWQPEDYTIVLDEMTAKEPGDYSFVLGWRSLGQPSLQPGAFETRQDAVTKQGVYYGGGTLLNAINADSGKYCYVIGNYDAVLCRSTEIGDYLQGAVTIPAEGEYIVAVDTLDYTGRGAMQVLIDGNPVGAPVDMFTAEGVKTRETELGRVTLGAGEHTVRFEVTGRNAASDDYYMAIRGIGFYTGAEQARETVDPNRFRLLFPSDVPATLDRDTETLGNYLPISKHHDQALNIVEQSMSAELAVDQSACFQNVFYAYTDERDVQIRRLDDHCMLVKDGDDIALFGASFNGTEITLGQVSASGSMFYVAPEQIRLTEATVNVGDQAVSDMGGATGEAIRSALAAAWDAAEAGGAAGQNPWADTPALSALWTADLPGVPLSVQACDLQAGEGVAAGLETGHVVRFSAEGRRAGAFETGAEVHALEAADLDGDGRRELLVGSDDEHIYALKPDMTELWSYRVPFLKEEQIWLWWTLGTSKVRKIHAGDITGDGVPELLLGVGNMRLHCLDAKGNEQWRFRTDHGICTTITTADVFSEGKSRVVAGNGLTSSAGTCWVLDETGKQLQRYYNGSWCTALPAIAVGDLDGDGKQTVFCGNNRGDVRSYPGAVGNQTQNWIHNLTRPIRSLTIVPREGGDAVAVGSDSGYLCAFNEAGEKVFGTPLSSAIVDTLLVERAGAASLLVAGCKDGRIFVMDGDGALTGVFDTKARLQAITGADLNADGTEEIIAVTSGPDRMWAVGVE
ncbi:MAG TPA: hypothetical protein DGT21_13630 [Armatimonadetes bacterium]|nr:hypothetical protein [Armatimonadota bacterium]